MLFRGSVYSNVVNGMSEEQRKTLPDEKKLELVQLACISANAHEFIESLPKVISPKSENELVCYLVVNVSASLLHEPLSLIPRFCCLMKRQVPSIPRRRSRPGCS